MVDGNVTGSYPQNDEGWPETRFDSMPEALWRFRVRCNGVGWLRGSGGSFGSYFAGTKESIGSSPLAMVEMGVEGGSERKVPGAPMRICAGWGS